WKEARAAKRQVAIQKAKALAAERTARRHTTVSEAQTAKPDAAAARTTRLNIPIAEKVTITESLAPADPEDEPPFDVGEEEHEKELEIPIRTLDQRVIRTAASIRPEEPPSPAFADTTRSLVTQHRRKQVYRIPPSELLNEVPPGSGYDGQELKEIASRIKSK